MNRYQLIKWDEYYPTIQDTHGVHHQYYTIPYDERPLRGRTIICGPHAVELSKEYAYRQEEGDDS